MADQQRVPTSDIIITSGAISITFDLETQTITRSSGSFISDGFAIGDVITSDAVVNYSNYTVTDVQTLVITVSSRLEDEGPVTKTVNTVRWARSTGADNYALIDEYPSTGDTDYNSTSTPDLADKSNFAVFTLESPVAAVTVYVRGKSAGSGAKIAGGIRVNGTWYWGTQTNFGTSFAEYAFTWSENPNTSAPWVVADVNGSGPNPLQAFGYKSGPIPESLRTVSRIYLEASESFEYSMSEDPLEVSVDMEINQYVIQVGQSSISLPSITVSSDGATGNVEVNIELPMLQVSSEGYQPLNQAKITIPVIEVSAEGVTGVIGSAEISLPAIRIEAGADHIYGDVDIELPLVRITARGLSSIIGECEISIPVIGVEASGRENALGDVSISMPMFYIEALGKAGFIEEAQKTFVMNVSNKAITEYLNFNFNSYCKFGDKFFGANTNGIFLLGGDSGEEAIIKSQVRFAAYNIPKPLVHRPREVWVSFRSNGQLIITVRLNEKDTWEDIIPIISDNIDEGRQTFAKGLKGSCFEFGIKNRDGADFDLESIRVMIDELRGGKK